MIKFKAKDMTDRGYSKHVMGNGGEEEFVFFTSWGQDKKSSLIIVTASVDDHCRVVYDSKKRIAAAAALAVVLNRLFKWAHTGMDKSEDLKKLNKTLKKIEQQLVYDWGMEG